MSTRHVQLRSLAKINLDLRVLNKRQDGYHELRTIFQTISLADTLEISFTPHRSTQILLESKAEIPENLAVRAAHLYFKAAKVTGHAIFRLDKKIPMGGGLGGGSSNAATVLLALPAVTGTRLPFGRLLELALQLGSDVPFFLFGGTALGLGRGDELYPIPEPPSRPALIVAPGIHVSTPLAFRMLNRELTDALPSRNISDFQSVAWKLGEKGAGSVWNVSNDFESVVFREHPQLHSIKRKLQKLGARPALMSGSGSTIFGIFEDAAARDAALASIRPVYDTVRPVSLVSRVRYHAMWWRQLADHINAKTWPPQSRYLR